ncbi:MAG TPA: hypothetical protein VLA58_06600, partial [Chitinophagaceae bacterium]|nr:hypothetical protein [Chitinophagaceae bacterium]
MVKFFICIVILVFSKGTLLAQLIPYVQPLSGTAPSTTAAAMKHSEGGEKNANTIPSVCVPFAMTQWTPQTRTSERKCLPPYYYKDSLLTGFRGTHWLSGSCVQDYGSFTIMPVKKHIRTHAADYALPFTHANESSSPHYYFLKAGGIRSEMTSTPRCGILRFTIDSDDSLYILVTVNSDESQGFMKVNEETGEIWGYNPVHRIYQGWGEPAGFNGWIYIKLDRTAVSSGSFSEAKI